MEEPVKQGFIFQKTCRLMGHKEKTNIQIQIMRRISFSHYDNWESSSPFKQKS